MELLSDDPENLSDPVVFNTTLLEAVAKYCNTNCKSAYPPFLRRFINVSKLNFCPVNSGIRSQSHFVIDSLDNAALANAWHALCHADQLFLFDSVNPARQQKLIDSLTPDEVKQLNADLNLLSQSSGSPVAKSLCISRDRADSESEFEKVGKAGKADKDLPRKKAGYSNRTSDRPSSSSAPQPPPLVPPPAPSSNAATAPAPTEPAPTVTAPTAPARRGNPAPSQPKNLERQKELENRVVIIDKLHPRFRYDVDVEAELGRLTSGIRVIKTIMLDRGGARVICETVAMAETLIAKADWPDDAFGGKARFHRSKLYYDLFKLAAPSRQPVDAASSPSEGNIWSIAERESRLVQAWPFPTSLTAQKLCEDWAAHVIAVKKLANRGGISASMLCIMKTADLARQLISDDGLTWSVRRINGRLVRPQSSPPKCLFCNSYEHVTHDCKQPIDKPVCGYCKEAHFTYECPNKGNVDKRFCTACNVSGHTCNWFHCPARQRAIKKDRERILERIKAINHGEGQPAQDRRPPSHGFSVAPPPPRPAWQGSSRQSEQDPGVSSIPTVASAISAQDQLDAVVNRLAPMLKQMVDEAMQRILPELHRHIENQISLFMPTSQFFSKADTDDDDISVAMAVAATGQSGQSL